MLWSARLCRRRELGEASAVTFRVAASITLAGRQGSSSRGDHHGRPWFVRERFDIVAELQSWGWSLNAGAGKPDQRHQPVWLAGKAFPFGEPPIRNRCSHRPGLDVADYEVDIHRPR